MNLQLKVWRAERATLRQNSFIPATIGNFIIPLIFGWRAGAYFWGRCEIHKWKLRRHGPNINGVEPPRSDVTSALSPNIGTHHAHAITIVFFMTLSKYHRTHAQHFPKRGTRGYSVWLVELPEALSLEKRRWKSRLLIRCGWRPLLPLFGQKGYAMVVAKIGTWK
jgi:hypothetical protein